MLSPREKANSYESPQSLMNACSPNDAVVQLKNVSRAYGTKLALDRVSLEIPRGVVLGLVGAIQRLGRADRTGLRSGSALLPQVRIDDAHHQLP